jgi:hypothetical protein
MYIKIFVIFSARYSGITFNINKSNKKKTGYGKLKEYMGQHRKTRSEVFGKIMKCVVSIRTGMRTHLELRRLEWAGLSCRTIGQEPQRKRFLSIFFLFLSFFLSFFSFFLS